MPSARPTVLGAKDTEELRGLLNAGHTRDSAYAWRYVAVGDDFEPKRFNVFGFKAVAGINAERLSETITSRSIVIHMRKRCAGEPVQRLRHAPPELFETLRSRLARWAEDHAADIGAARPDLPQELDDRSQDNFESLLAVADEAGGRWPAYAPTVCLMPPLGLCFCVEFAKELFRPRPMSICTRSHQNSVQHGVLATSSICGFRLLSGAA